MYQTYPLKDEDFSKKIKPQQSNLARKIPVCREIQFSKKNRRNEKRGKSAPVLVRKPNFRKDWDLCLPDLIAEI